MLNSRATRRQVDLRIVADRSLVEDLPEVVVTSSRTPRPRPAIALSPVSAMPARTHALDSSRMEQPPQATPSNAVSVTQDTALDERKIQRKPTSKPKHKPKQKPKHTPKTKPKPKSKPKPTSKSQPLALRHSEPSRSHSPLLRQTPSSSMKRLSQDARTNASRHGAVASADPSRVSRPNSPIPKSKTVVSKASGAPAAKPVSTTVPAGVHWQPLLERNPSTILCHVCLQGDETKGNAIVICGNEAGTRGCETAVHQQCYGIPMVCVGVWLDARCFSVSYPAAFPSRCRKATGTVLGALQACIPYVCRCSMDPVFLPHSFCVCVF